MSETTEQEPAAEIFLPPEPLWVHRVTGNQVVALDDPQKVWLVKEGGADVFALLPGDERSGHRRHHLFRVRAGGALFGLAVPPEAGAVGLVAVPTAAGEIVEVSVPDLLSRHGEGRTERRAAAVDAWVEQLARSTGRDEAVAHGIALEPGTEVTVPPDSVVRAPHRVVWAEVLAGEIEVGLEAYRATLPAGEAFPVSPGFALTARREARLRGRTTAEKLTDGSIRPALRKFHAVALGSIIAGAARQTGDEAARLAYATEQQQTAVDTALHQLEHVLGTRGAAFEFHPDAAVPLLDAFRLVADSAGIEVKTPRAVQQIVGRSDPVGALARMTGTSIRRIELDDAWWRRDGGPMLGALAEDRRPVALLPRSARRYVLVDPQKPEPEPVTEALAARLERNAYVLYRPFPSRAIRPLEIVRDELLRHGLDLFSTIAAGLLGGVLAMLVPILTGIIFDQVIPQANRDLLGQYFALLCVGAVAVALFAFGQSISLLRIRGKMDGAIQSAVWDRLLKLPMSFFRHYNAGDLANRAMGINAISSALTGVTLVSVFAGVFSVFSAALMFYYDWKLAIIGAVFVLVAAIVSLLLYRAQLHYQRQLYDLGGRIAGQVLQILNGIAKLQVAAAERRAFAAWASNFAAQQRLSLKAHSRANALTVTTSGIHTLSTLAIFIGVAFFSSQIEVGTFVAFNAAFGQFFGGVMGLLRALNTSLAVVPLYERARPILSAIPERDVNVADPGELRGRIDLDQVSFRYDPNSEFVLNRVSLTIHPGEFLAVVGPSGAGKTTLFRLLLGFETPENGAISYDLRNMTGVDVHALRRQLGIVLQDGKLMPGSIFDNIVGSAPLTEDDAWEAARVAGLEDSIRALPMGMNTFVSEGAVTFSGGQRQRLMIARAVVKKPRILLFDEATSALDNETQSVVTEAIARLNATRIVIAHRLSTTMRADRIVVLEGGQLVQSGTYDALIAQSGRFADLARRQMA